MIMMVVATDRLCQILDVGKLAVLRGVGEVRRELVELVRLSRIAARLCSLGGALQVRGDLLCDLLILGWIRLQKLLQRAQQLRERRKLAVVLLLPDRGGIGGAWIVPGRVGCQAGILKCGAELRQQKTAEIIDG